MPTTGICDLPQDLIGKKILTRIPVTSLRQVRSTCKSWDALTKSWILGDEAASTEQFVGFMTMNSKVCSLRFLVKHKGDKKDLVDVSINQVDLLNQVEVSEIFHSYGLLLCVAKDKDKLKLLVWNPYLYQTRWIRPRTKFHGRDKYALGYDMNHNHKIMRFMDYYTGGPEEYEIYKFSSDSWRVLDVTPHWEIPRCHRGGASVKGNAYFYAQEKLCGDDFGKELEEIEDFLICFDFTREKFGPRLPLPFHSVGDECVTLSCVGDEQLAVLYYQEGINHHSCGKVEIWVTTRIEPDRVSWSNFLKVDMSPFALTGVKFDEEDGGGFFIDEQEKVAVVFDLDGYIPTLEPAPARYHTAFVIGQDGLFESVRLGEAPNLGKRCPRTGYLPLIHIPALVCSSSYRPSLVQVEQPGRKRKRCHV